MKRKLIAAAAAALTLGGVGAANAQLLVTEPTYIVEPAPVYSEPVVVAPRYSYVAPSGYVLPRDSYTISTPARTWRYDAAYYGEPMSCSIDIFGNRTCF